MMTEISSLKIFSAFAPFCFSSMVKLMTESTLCVSLMKLNTASSFCLSRHIFLEASFQQLYLKQQLLLLFVVVLCESFLERMRLVKTYSLTFSQCFQYLTMLSLSRNLLSRLGMISQYCSSKNLIFLSVVTLFNSLKFPLQNSTSILLTKSCSLNFLQASCKILYSLSLNFMHFDILAFSAERSRFLLLSCVIINLRLVIRLGVLEFFEVERYLYFMSQRVSSSYNLFFNYVFLVLVCSLTRQLIKDYLLRFQFYCVPNIAQYFPISALCFSNSSSFMELRKANCEFSTLSRSNMVLSSFISLKYIILMQEEGPQLSSLPQFYLSSIALTVSSLFWIDTLSQQIFSQKLAMISRNYRSASQMS